MIIDKEKKEFIALMENIHQSMGYTKGMFGLITSLMVEERPTHQDRIIELTGYSRSVISSLISKTQALFPIKIVKIQGKRKKHYQLEDEPENFLMGLFIRILDQYETNLDFIKDIVRDLDLLNSNNAIILNFKNFLQDFFSASNVLLMIFNEITTIIKKNSFLKIEKIFEERTKKMIIAGKMQEFLEIMMKPPEISSDFYKTGNSSVVKEKWYNKYILVKQKFYQKLFENFTKITENFPQIASAIINFDIIIEQRPLTQEEIEHSTQYKRSIISDVLATLLNRGTVSVIKRPSDRKKYYKSQIKWKSSMERKIKKSLIYSNAVMQNLMKIKVKIEKKIKDSKKQVEVLNFLKILNRIEKSYEVYEKLMKYSEYELIKRLYKTDLGQN